MKKNVAQLLTKESRDLIVDALAHYKDSVSRVITTLDDAGEGSAESMRYLEYDLTGLIGMMHYDVEVRLPNESKDKFASRHGIDFPEYTEDVESRYPIIEDEWVTVIVGNIMYTDGTHGREAGIISIHSIQKHLRSQLDAVVGDIESEGHQYLVVDDYDGRIEIEKEVEDLREFLVVDAVTNKNSKYTYKGLTEDEDDENFIRTINNLDIGGSMERHTNEIYIIRTK